MDYSVTKPAIQIGILNFTLFPKAPEFYANYYMMNEKTYQKYSDKFRLAVVDLTQIELATEEDRAYQIEQWAQFFISKDWSELAMLARDNTDIQAAMGTVYQLSKEKKIRQQCEAREDYYKRERDRQRRDALAEERERKIEEMEQQLEEKEQQVEEKEQQVEEKEQQIEKKEQLVEEKEQQVEKDRKDLIEWERRLREKERDIALKLQEVNGGQNSF